MSRYVHRIICTAICMTAVTTLRVTAQNLTLSSPEYNFTELVEGIEEQTDYVITYSPDLINTDEYLSLPNDNYTLTEVLEEIEDYYKVLAEIRGEDNRILILTNRKWVIQGKVMDGISNESLQGVNIITSNGNITITNQDGFFSLTENFRDIVVYFSYIGYRYDSLSIQNFCQDEFIIELHPDNVIQAVVISDSPNREIHQNPEKNIPSEQLKFTTGIGGTSDLFSYIKSLPGVSNGSEGQNGIQVRGGGPDQNLILLDGLPVYEASHLGGLSSVFISDAIKNIDFYKSGFPARFGGKLSSVLDVRLKEGHRSEYKRSVNFGLDGIQGHMEGPLGEKTSFNLNGKLSWFSLLASPLLKESLDFNESSLNYSDAYAKITHWFSPSNRLSFSFYRGNDLIRLTRDQDDQGQNFSIKDFNRIEWGNTLVSVNWNQTLSEKIFSTTSIGVTSFNYSSRGSYDINFEEIDTTGNRSFDIFSNSKLRDINVTQSFDYYTGNAGTFKFGGGYIRHRNAPSIKESDAYLDPQIPQSIALDSTFLSYELFLFAENRINLSKRLSVHSGLRLNYFGGLDASYLYLQPRLDLNYEFSHSKINISYARMSQFIHLLVNPGPGLPSDLWVPSTSKVAPEISDLIAIKYSYSKNNFFLSLGPYYNHYSNVIDYFDVSDILYSLIIDDQLFNLTVDNSNWEDRIRSGRGWSYGAEFHLIFTYRKFMFDASYTWSRSDRQFDELNNGEAFPYKYDRRHNLSSRLVYNIKDNQAIQLNWAFGTGNSFTSSTEEILGPDGEPRLVPISRNNARVPDYHHLDIMYSVSRTLDNEARIKYSFGIYNVYNRLNPFYVYLFQNPDTKQFEGFRKISIYPVIPQVNIKYSW